MATIYDTPTSTITGVSAINVYDNEVLQTKIKSALNTALNLQNFATVDYSLTAAPGMQVNIRTYTPSGEAERLEMGQANTTYVGADFVEADYRVNTLQATAKYFDEQDMADPTAIDTTINQLPTAITNKLNSEVIAEMNKATIVVNSWTPTVTAVLDALAKFPEDEVLNAGNKFLLVNNADYLALIKDAISKSMYVKDNTNTNSLGSVAGVPVYVSKLVPDGKAFLGDKTAVTIYTKKGYGVETNRDIEKRATTMVANVVNVVALTDAKHIVKLDKAAAASTPSNP